MLFYTCLQIYLICIFSGTIAHDSFLDYYIRLPYNRDATHFLIVQSPFEVFPTSTTTRSRTTNHARRGIDPVGGIRRAARRLLSVVLHARPTSSGRSFRASHAHPAVASSVQQASARPDGFHRRFAAAEAADGDGDGDGRVPAGHQASALVVRRGESRRRRHPVGHNRRIQLSDRLARLRHSFLGRRSRAHRYERRFVSPYLGLYLQSNTMGRNIAPVGRH